MPGALDEVRFSEAERKWHRPKGRSVQSDPLTPEGAIPLLATASAELRWRSGWSVTAKFDGELATRARTYAGSGTLRYRW